MSIDWSLALSHLVRVLVAGVLAMPIAWQREQTTRTMGLRTFPLVSVASCGFVLLAVQVVGPTDEAQARIIQGLMTGMGFIGGGAILKESGGVRGTATAAGIWSTGVIGSSVGYGEFEVALVVSAVTLGILLVLTPIERNTGKDDRRGGSDQDRPPSSS